MCYDLPRPKVHLDPRLNLRLALIEVINYIIRCAFIKRARLCTYLFFTFKWLDIIDRQIIQTLIYLFDEAWNLCPLTLCQLWWSVLLNRVIGYLLLLSYLPSCSFALNLLLLALPGIILEMSPIFCEKNARYLENFVVFTRGGTRYDLLKNDLSIFCRLRQGLSVVLHYCCYDARFLVS